MSALRSVRLFAAAVVMFALVAVGCSAPPSESAAQPTVASLIDARWMGFDTSQPWNWTAIDRRIAADFQQFGFRPVGETRGPHHCEGCGSNAPTAVVTIHAPGTFDPTDALNGQSVDVAGHGGFLRAYGDKRPPTVTTDPFEDAILTWQYADGAWATVRGLTPLAAEVDRMVELASAVRPDQRTPARFPLSLHDVPKDLPLASIHELFEPITSVESDYETRLDFAPCVDVTKSGRCGNSDEAAGSLRVLVLPGDGYHDRLHDHDVALKVGGEDGRYDSTLGWAAVPVGKDMVVQFDLSQDAGELGDILANVVWAPDPGNEATWTSVSDWTT